jgi:lipopolysaccharide transport system permease protein
MILFFFPVLLVQLIFAMGLGLTLGVLNVFFRDVGQLFVIVLQFWFWLTPIVYPAEILPASIATYLLELNPMAAIIRSYQGIFVYSASPDWQGLMTPLFLGFLLCLLAMRLFTKYGDEIVDEL